VTLRPSPPPVDTLRQSPDQSEEVASVIRTGRPYRKYRLVILSIGLVLAASLLLRGQLVLGALIGGLALVRIAFFGLFARRRQSFGYARSAGPVQELLRSLVRGDFEAAAAALGTQATDLRREFEAGQSIADSAQAAGVPVDRVVDAVIRYASGRIDQLASEGAVSLETASRAKQRLPIWASRFVERRNPVAAGGLQA
jgi:hypothetical protein